MAASKLLIQQRDDAGETRGRGRRSPNDVQIGVSISKSTVQAIYVAAGALAHQVAIVVGRCGECDIGHVARTIVRHTRAGLSTRLRKIDTGPAAAGA